MNWTILRRAGMTTTADEFEDARIEVTEAGVLIVRQQGMNAPTHGLLLHFTADTNGIKFHNGASVTQLGRVAGS